MKPLNNVNDPDKVRLIHSLQEHQIELEMQNEELRIARQKAEFATQKYIELYDFAPSGYFTLSLDGDILELNLCGSQMLGKERMLLINNRFNLFVSNDTQQVFNRLLDEVLQTKTTGSCEIALNIRDLNPQYVQLTCNLTDSGESFLLSAVDITSRKKEEEELKRSRQLISSSIQSQKEILLLMIDTEYRYLYFNEAHFEIMESVYGKKIEAGRNILEYITPIDYKELMQGYLARSMKGESHTQVWNFAHRPLIFYQSFFHPIIDENHVILGVTCFSIDITIQKVAEELMRQSKARLDRTQEISHLGSWELDLESGQLYWSDEAYRILGLLPQEIEPSYESFLEIVHPDDRKAIDLAYFNSLEENRSGYEIEHRLVQKHSTQVRFVFMKCEHIRDSYGKIIRSVGLIQDITEQKRAQEALVESEQKFRSFVQNSSDLIFSFNRDETYRFVNEGFARLFGIDPSDIVGKTRHAIFPFEEAENGLEVLRHVFRTGVKAERETTVISPTGAVTYLLTTADPIKNEQGEVLYVNCVAKDITKLKISELALRESEEIFQSFMEFSPIFVFFKDINIRTLKLSRNFESMLGKPLSEMLGRNMDELFPSDLSKSIVKDDLRTLEEGKVISVEEELNGRSYSTIKFPILIDGKPKYLAGYTIDITERKNAEFLLRKSEAQVSALLAAIPDMIFIQDSSGVYLDYHGPLSSELYIKPENFLGKKMSDVIPSDVARLFNDAFENTARTGEVQLCEYSMQLPDGLNYYEAKVAPFAETKFLTITRNVSNYKRAELIIKQKNTDLVRINAEKDKFFSIIAHDLRGPFSGFLGITETLAKRLPDMTLKEIQEITFLMRNSAVHLFRLIGNLLEWSRMQRGLTTFVSKSFLFRQKIEGALDLAKQLALQKEIKININFPDDLTVFADENMFDSIVRNLFSNAIKYTHRGGKIDVSASQIPGNMVEILFVDNGIGMNKTLIDQLFRIDRQSNRKGTEGEYSSGLGLIICKDFIEKHGGNLMIVSKEGEGSRICFTLPGENF